MLTGPEIRRQVEAGEVGFDPPPARYNPNSVNLRLGPKIKMYAKHRQAHCAWEWAWGRYQLSGHWPLRWEDLLCEPLDCKKEEPWVEWEMPADGQRLWPNLLYLASTVEVVRAGPFVPTEATRSGVARLGVSTNLSAGFGDTHFGGDFTLEVTVVQAVVVYPGMEICQIALTRPDGRVVPYQGSYANQRGPQTSKLWRDFAKD